MKKIVSKKSFLSLGFVALLGLIFSLASCKNGLSFPKEEQSSEKAKVYFTIDGIKLFADNFAARVVHFNPNTDTLLYKLDCTNKESGSTETFKLTEMFDFRSGYIDKSVTLDLGTWDFELSAYQFVVDESNMAIVYPSASADSSDSSQGLTPKQLEDYLAPFYTENNKLFVAEVSDYTLDDPRISYSVNFEMQALEASDNDDDLITESGDFNYYIVALLPENLSLTRPVEVTAKYTAFDDFLKGSAEWNDIPAASITDVTEQFIQLGYIAGYKGLVISPEKPIGNPKDVIPIVSEDETSQKYKAYKIAASLNPGRYYLSFTLNQTVYDDDEKTVLGTIATYGGEILEITQKVTVSNFKIPKKFGMNSLNKISYDLGSEDASFGEDLEAAVIPRTYSNLQFIMLPVPIRRGYDFMGWTTNPVNNVEEGEAKAEIEIEPYGIFEGKKYFEKGDITLYACWKKEDKLTFYYNSYVIDGEDCFNYSCTRKIPAINPDYDLTKPLKAGDTVIVKLTGTSPVDLDGFICQIADFEGEAWINEIGDYNTAYEYPVKAEEPFTQFFIVNIKEDSLSAEECGISINWFPETKPDFDSFTLTDSSFSFRVYGQNDSLSLYRDDGFMFNRLESVDFEDITYNMPESQGGNFKIYGAKFKLTDTDLIAYLNSDMQEDDVYTIDIAGISNADIKSLQGQLINIESGELLSLSDLLSNIDEKDIVGYSVLTDTIIAKDELGNEFQTEKEISISANKEISGHFDFALTQSLESFENVYVFIFYSTTSASAPATITDLAAATMYSPQKQFIERKETEHMLLEACEEGVEITITRKEDDPIWKDNIDITEEESGTQYRIPEEVFANTDTITFIYPFCEPGKTYRFSLGYNNTKEEGAEYGPYHVESGKITAGGGKGELDYSEYDKINLSLTEDDLGRYFNIENFTSSLHESMYKEMELDVAAISYEITFCSGKWDWSDNTSWVYGQTDYIEDIAGGNVSENDFYKAIVNDGTVNLLDEHSRLWKSPVQLNQEFSSHETYWAEFKYKIQIADYDYDYSFEDKDGETVTYSGTFYTKGLKTEETPYTPMVFAEGMTITVQLPKYESGNISISQKITDEGIVFACDREGLDDSLLLTSYSWVLSSVDEEKSLSSEETCTITDEIKADFKNGVYALSLVAFDERENMYAATAYITVSNAGGAPVENIQEESSVDVTFPEYKPGELGIKKTESSSEIIFSADESGLSVNGTSAVELVSYIWSFSTPDADEIVSTARTYTFTKAYSSTLDNGVYALSLTAFDEQNNMYAATAYVKVTNEGGNPIQDKEGGNGINISFPTYSTGDLQIKQANTKDGGILFTLDDEAGKYADYDFCVWSLAYSDDEEVVSETTSFELSSEKIAELKLEEKTYSLTVFIKTKSGIFADATIYISK